MSFWWLGYYSNWDSSTSTLLKWVIWAMKGEEDYKVIPRHQNLQGLSLGKHWWHVISLQILIITPSHVNISCVLLFWSFGPEKLLNPSSLERSHPFSSTCHLLISAFGFQHQSFFRGSHWTSPLSSWPYGSLGMPFCLLMIFSTTPLYLGSHRIKLRVNLCCTILINSYWVASRGWFQRTWC